MRRGEGSVRRRTRELHRLIGETVGRGLGRAGASAVLFVDRAPPGFSGRVLRDAVLEPVDKVVWMVLRRSGAKGRFPSHAQIARIANVRSKSTVSRAIAILRAERWLSLCVAGEPRSGGAGGAVYALHDKPLPVADAVYLDAGYFAFLQFTQGHSHARVRRVGWRILAGLEGDIEGDTYPLGGDGSERRRERDFRLSNGLPGAGRARSIQGGPSKFRTGRSKNRTAATATRHRVGGCGFDKISAKTGSWGQQRNGCSKKSPLNPGNGRNLITR